MTSDLSDVLVHLRDLQKQSEKQYKHTESQFLNEEEQGLALKEFPEDAYTKYDGGYPGARKKKVIFLRDEEDDFSDIVCLEADIDQRFRKIGHRDILGSLMSLGIDRHSFGDFWMEEDKIYLYTSKTMGQFLIDNFLRIANLNVSFRFTEQRPVQIRKTKAVEVILSSLRYDAVVAGLAHTSRTQAKQMIQQGLVQVNHVTLVSGDKTCNNNCTISIRGHGRFTFTEVKNHTKKDRIVCEFIQDIS